jgi:hypothetical protein
MAHEQRLFGADFMKCFGLKDLLTGLYGGFLMWIEGVIWRSATEIRYVCQRVRRAGGQCGRIV